MAEIDISADEGWQAIVVALSQAAPTDHIRLGTGLFEGTETLSIPSGVTLSSHPDCRLQYLGTTSAILSENAKDVTLRSLHLTGYGDLPNIGDDAESDLELLEGLISGRDCEGMLVEDCRLYIPTQRRAGVSLTRCQNAIVNGNIVEGARRGIYFDHTSGCITKNESYTAFRHGISICASHYDVNSTTKVKISENICLQSGMAGLALFSASASILGNEFSSSGNGIFLCRYFKHPETPSQADISENRCQDNAGTGIALMSSIGRVHGNRCWGNRLSGIALQRGEGSVDAASDAEIRDNCCHGNGQAGIAIFSSTARVFRNVCFGSEIGGIVLQRDKDAPEAPSEGEIEDNVCYGNEEAGIALSSSIGRLRRNKCWNNKLGGIVLQRSSIAPDVASDALVDENRCYENGDGITVRSSIARLYNNECWSNSLSGIAVLRQDVSPNAASEVDIENNRCHHNKRAGVGLVASNGRLNRNHCWLNSLSGIILERGQKPHEFPADADVVENFCHENMQNGILLLSSTGRLYRNECWKNQSSGISLAHAANSSGVGSGAEIDENFCHQNGASGVSLGSSTGRLRGNNCWANTQSGILLTRDDKFLSTASDAEVDDNCCHGNGDSGIGVFSSTGHFRRNECWANTLNGVTLARYDKSPNAAPEVIIEAGRYHHNKQAGIVVVASNASLYRNESWGNRRFGISLDRQSFDALEGNTGGLKKDSNFCFGNGEAALSIDGAPAVHDLVCQRPRISIAPLIKQIESKGIKGAEDLAGFLTSSCDACYRDFHRANLPTKSLHDGFIKPNSGHQTFAEAFSSVAFNLKFATGKISAYPLGSRINSAADAAADAIVSLLAQSGDVKGRVHWMGLVSTTEIDPAHLLEKAEKKIRYMGLASAGAEEAQISSFVTDYSAQNDYKGHAAQSAHASNMGALPVFEAECLQSAKWREQLVCITFDPAIWAMLAFIVALIGASFLPPMQLALKGVPTFCSGWINKHLVLSFIVVLASPLLVTTVINAILLPKPLRFPTPRWIPEFIIDVLLKVLEQDFLKPLSKALSRPAKWCEERAWRRWVSRHVFTGNGQIACLIFRSVESWNKEDLRKIEDLIINAPHQKPILLVVQMNDRSFVQPALFGLLMRFYGKLDIEDVSDLGKSKLKKNLMSSSLFLSDEQSCATEHSNSMAADEVPSLASLLGWYKADKDIAKDEVEKLANSLRYDAWSVVDMLPVLVLGSTPTARFHIRAPNTKFGNVAGPLGRELEPFRAIFEDKENSPIDAMDWSIVETSAKFARSIQYSHLELNDDPFIRMEGLIGARSWVEYRVRGLWGKAFSSEKADRYIAKAVLCGVWRHLTDIELILRLGLGEIEQARKVLMGFKALRYLEVDLLKHSKSAYRPTTIVDSWRSLSTLMEAAVILDDDAIDKFKLLLIEIFTEYLGCAETMKSSDDFAIFQGDLVVDVEKELIEPTLIRNSTLRWLFVADAARNISSLRLMEPGLAEDTLNRLRRQMWASLPAVIFNAFRDQVSLELRALPVLLLNAKSAESLDSLIELHRDQPHRLLYILAVLASNQVMMQNDLSGEDQNSRLTSIGQCLTSVLIGMGSWAYDAYWTSSNFNVDRIELARSRGGGTIIVDYLLGSGAGEWLLMLLKHPSDSCTIDGILDEELDRVLAVGEILQRQFMGDRTYEVMRTEPQFP